MTPPDRSPRVRYRYHLSSVAVVVAALVSACGGESHAPTPEKPSSGAQVKPDPLLSYKRQHVDWKACDPTMLAEHAQAIDPAQLNARATCSTIRVPLDYANPAQGDAAVALLKFSAAEPKQRAGAFAVNPGGPGGDGLLWAAYYGLLWSEANAQNPTGALLKTLSDRYDIIGFSPRGVGSSSRLYCDSNEPLRPTQDTSADRSPGNIADMIANARAIADACQKNPFAKHIHTDATARDMDIIRAILGDEKLNYIGTSYGTWLGAWYASLFPERTGRVLLDSSMQLTGTFDDNLLLQRMARQRVLDDVLAPLAARAPEAVNLGNTVDEVRQVFTSLPSELRAVVANRLPTSSSDDWVQALILLTGANGLHRLMTDNPQADQQAIAQKTASFTFAAQPEIDAVARYYAQVLNDAYFARLARQSKPVRLLPERAVNRSVICNDTPTQPNVDYWVDKGNEFARKYPLSGGSVTENPCLFWKRPAILKPPLPTATPILMVHSEFDAATALEGAMDSFAALPNASLILVANEYTHGVYPYRTDCVDAPIAHYLATGEMPARNTQCDGKTLPASEPAVRAAPRAKESVGTYRDPQRANRLIDQIHEIIQRNPIQF